MNVCEIMFISAYVCVCGVRVCGVRVCGVRVCGVRVCIGRLGLGDIYLKDFDQKTNGCISNLVRQSVRIIWLNGILFLSYIIPNLICFCFLYLCNKRQLDNHERTK